MIWLTGIICFAIGLCTGAILFKQFKSDAVKIKQLEEQLDALASEHNEYRQSVHSHFTTTAQLFHNLTDSYRDVYNHLAIGAQSLCPDNVANQLSPAGDNRDILTDSSNETDSQSETDDMFSPPRDYAAKTRPDQKGNLAEDYGLREEATETARSRD